MFRSLIAHKFLLRVSLVFTICTALLLASIPLTSKAAPAQSAGRAARPRPGKPEGVLPDLADVEKESNTTREPAPPIPSSMRSPKNPLRPWNGRRVGDPGTSGQAKVGATYKVLAQASNTLAMRGQDNRTRRAHVSRNAAPPTVLDDQYIANFFNWAVVRAASGNESTYWNDQLRVAYAQGQPSLKLAAVELGKTLFESAEYAARNRDNHWYVYDLYKTYLMREPDAPGWAHWEGEVPNNGRENVRRAFEESPEFLGIIASILPNGSATANAASLISARVDPRNQPGNGMLTRDGTWSVPLLSLPGRAGLDLGLGLSYSSMVWTRNGPYIHFDEDNGFPSPGFRLGFPIVQRKVFDAQTAKNSFLFITASGRRVELRRVGSSNVYEAGDSSYLQLIDNSPNLLVRSTDGTQLSFVQINNEYSCTQIKDRNGNYITVNHNALGRITTITDTLGRVVTFNYDGNANLLSITQLWNGQTHTWATFGWTSHTMQPGFGTLRVVGTATNAALPVLMQVGLSDGSRYNFEYTSAAQVSVIRRYRADNTQPLYTVYQYEATTTDCPRLSQTRVAAENWTSLNGVPAEVTTYFAVDPDGACRITAPDGTIYKEYYGTGWQKGLTTSSEVWSGGVKQKWTTTAWTQDNTSVGYETNPRVTETNTYDSGGNRRRMVIEYAGYASWGLPYVVREYAADGITEIRHTYTDYHLGQAFLDRRLIGLVSEVHVTNISSYQAKLVYSYDNPAQLQALPTAATQHDSTYSTSFTTRGNVTAVARWDVTDINNPAKALTTQIRYNTSGAVIATSDPSGHQSTVSYGDSFSDSVNRNTFAYPTTFTDADGFSSSVQYNFDFGAKTRTQGPPPAGQSQSAIQTITYDSIGRVERTTIANNGAYTRYVYGPNFVQSFATINNIADEAYAIQVFDGVGRVIGSAGNHPGSIGGYRAQMTVYDLKGRAVKTSNPAEITGAWAPAGDDAAGWLYTQQTYDWQGRPLVTTNPNLTTKEVSYAGCGCAGGAVVTLTDEGTIDGGVAKRRQQRIYSDVLGRTVKTEALNWQGGSVYSTTVNTYNARDQVTLIRQYAGAEGSGTYQDTNMTYDGYGRLISRHVPEQNTGTATVWTYNADDTVNTITDARGATTTFGYAGTNRHLVKTIAHTLSGSPTINVSYNYDAVGNLTSMTDGLGSVTYTRNQLSQLTSETRTFTGVGSFPVNYAYNLGGQLTSVTDPFGAQVGYTHDNAGRTTAITGSNFASVSTYASGLQYRAWGALKSLNYGNSKSLALTYDANLSVASYEIPGLMKKSYQYYNDGRLKFTQDQFVTNSKFDRLYRYDHLGRTTIGLTGLEAREQGTTNDRPYKETMAYDAMDHLTLREVRQWDRYDTTGTETYVNNRRQGWQYDADGRLISGNGYFNHDAAGQIYSFGDWDPYKTDQQFDGDGRRAKSVLQSFDLGTSQWTTEKVTYYVHSSVLGAVISEVSAQGAKERSFVHNGGAVLAIQMAGGGQFVSWEHYDASGTSHRATNVQGAGAGAAERDPMGADAGLIKPVTWPEPTSPGKLEPYYGVPELNSATQGCVADGVPIPCDIALSLALNGGATVTHIDPILAAVGNKRPVWVPEDASYGTVDLDALVVTIYGGAGGHFIWVDELGAGLETSRQAQNPTNKGTPMTDAEIAKHRSAVEELLQDKACKSFVEGVLSQIGDAPRIAFNGDALSIFDKVTSLKGWGWRNGADMNFDLGEGGSYVGNTSQPAYINMSRQAQIYGDSSSTGFVGRLVIHELLHVGSRAVGNFSHWDMFKAGYSVAQSLGLKLGTRKPTEKDPGGRDIYNASGFDDLLFEACQIRRVRGIR